MSESFTSTSPQDTPSAADEPELLDALPVLAGDPPELRPQPVRDALPGQRRSGGVVLPAVQAAAVAAGGFVAGAALVGLVHRRQQRSSALGKGRRQAARGLGRGSRAPAKAVELVQIVGSRSLLVDVHLLGGSGER